MEEKTSSSGSSVTKYLVPVAVVAIIVIAAIFFYTQNNTKTDSAQQKNNSLAEQQPSPTVEVSSSTYKNGTYSAVGNYVSPGGPRTIELSVTLDDDVISDSTFVGTATDPTSMRFQGEFGDGYKEMIVGKNIDEVNLTKVAGSSLTPKGFKDALEKIKAQAQS